METVKFVQTFVVLVGVFGVSNIRGSVSLKKRMNVFESRITTLEMRLNTENEMIKTDVAVLGQDVASINNSVTFLEEICPSEGSQETIRKTKKSQKQSAKLDEILQISNTVFARGLDDEKKWIRARLTKYENQMQKSIDESKSEINDYKTEIDTKFWNETEWLRYKMDLYENEMRASFNENKNEMDSYMTEIDTKFSDEKEWLKSEVKKYKNETDSRLSKEKDWLRTKIEKHEIEMFESFKNSKIRINDYIAEIDGRFSEEKKLLRSKLDKYENEMHNSLNDGKSEMTLYKTEIDLRFSEEKQMIRDTLEENKNELRKCINNSNIEILIYMEEARARFDNESEWLRSKTTDFEHEMRVRQSDIEIDLSRYKREINDMLQMQSLKIDNFSSALKDVFIESTAKVSVFLIGRIGRYLYDLEHNMTSLVTQLETKLNSDVKTLQKEVLEIKKSFCPPGWTEFRSFCYKYVAEKRTYVSARDYCTTLNAHVADIESHTENDFLVKYVESIGHTWSDKVWIGLTDKATEGVWISDRTGRQTAFTNWRSGQPDGNKNGRDQNCVIIGNSSPRDQWNDWWCTKDSEKSKFICKKDKLFK